jgi:guanine deaminase
MNKYMFLAIEEATNGIEAGDGGPFGCVIVKNDEIVGRGHNRVVLKKDPTCHGEMEAIRDACKKLGTFDLSGCTLYTTGEPCPMCFGAILWANIEKVYYGCNVVDTDKIGFRDDIFYHMTAEKKAIFQTELDREECLKLYEKYMSIENKTNY